MQPLQGGSLVLGTLALSLATFMNVLDTTIANVSLPAIAGDLGVAPSQGTWVITSFAVANAIAVPLTGWLTQRFGQVRLFVTSVLLFVLASLLCGLAPNLEMLIAFRIVQGAVAGPMIPLSQALLLSSYPPTKSGIALALWSMTTMVAPVVGPILGGWLSDNLSWPWIFYINIPVGLLAAWATWRIYRPRETATRIVPIDRLGLVLLVLWVGALQIMLDKGKELDWFNSWEIIALGVTALIAFVVFLVWELTEEHPVVDLSLFRRRNFVTGTMTLSLAYGLFFGGIVIIPMWLQTQMGYTATLAGLVTAPVGILALLLSPIIGKSLAKVDPRAIASLSFVILAGVSFLRADFTTGADTWTLVLPQLILGAGMATLFLPLTSILLAGLPPQSIPAASGLSNFCRITAGAFGTSIATTAWENRTTLHHTQLVEHLTPYDPLATQARDSLASAGLSPEQTLGNLDRLVNNQASMIAANEYFWVSGFLFLSLLAIIWLAKPRTATPGPAKA
ncbi:DHA2 family efflux MFS transporter permease subunit [Rhodocyclus tenuis]|uniref:DHA2 family efflux MFS transporter permease subunit n=1 Tax=Rhodocyclus gracilis TaxID=2929842 RepID=A0ABX0WMM3_9RHOO|nr:DHA2 family efflux MFS transporter permease subunit [Rhodocyclus gracilis]NJA90004.1 DHA2 family efflux MFS transporter permease subunit [Rhodocyclus gracilis]